MGYQGAYRRQFGELPLQEAQKNIGFQLKFDAVLDSNFDKVFSELSNCSVSSFDTETVALDFHSDCAGFSFAIPQGKTYYIFVRHSNSALALSVEKQEQLLIALFSREIVFVFNAGYDLRVLKHEWPGIKITSRIIDVQNLVYLIDTNCRMPDLKSSERDLLGIEALHYEDVVGADGILYSDPAQLAYYGAFDAYGTLALGQKLYPILSKHYPFILDLTEAFIPVLMDMQDQVQDIDMPWMRELADKVSAEIESIKSQAYKDYGDINMNAPAQVAKKLVELGYDTGIRTDTGGMSTSKVAMQSLIGVPFVDTVLDYKQKFTLRSRYVEPFLLRDAYGLLVRINYKDTATPTWRLASGADGKKKKVDKHKGYYLDVNGQSLPKDHSISRRVDVNFDTMEIRFHDKGQYEVETIDPTFSVKKGLIAPPGCTWVSQDYSNQEVRVAANLSGEPVWLEAFSQGKDIHKHTAEAIWGVENYTKDLRKKAKSVTFGVILYGGSSAVIQRQLKISRDDADQLANQFKNTLPTLIRWINKTHTTARNQGYVLNAYGLPRRLSYYYRSGDNGLKGFADRSSVNTLCQSAGGCAARIFLKRMYDKINEKYKDTVKFRMTVHDSFDYIVRNDKVIEFIQDCSEEVKFTYPPNWIVPLTMDYSIGNNAGEQIPIKLENGKLIVDSQREFDSVIDDDFEDDLD